MELEGYISTLRYISARNKSGIIKVVYDMLKEYPELDIEEFLEKLYPERRY